MKAIVLAGGYGTRLWPITYNRPKMLLPLGKKTVLDTILEPLESDPRIDEVIVSTNQRFNEDLKTHIDNNGYQKPRLVRESTQAETEKPGAIGALARLTAEEEVSTDFVVIAGDHYIDFQLSDLLDYFETVDGPTITARNVGTKDEAKSYGVIGLEGELVESFTEKPSAPPSTLISPACYAFPAETIEQLNQYLRQGNDPDAPGWFIRWLVKNTDVYAHVVDGMIMDVGTRTNYINAVSWTLDGKKHVDSPATVEQSEMSGSVMILGNAKVIDSRISDSVIFPGASLENASVHNSIIDTESSLTNAHLQESLIGPHTQIRSGRGPI